MNHDNMPTFTYLGTTIWVNVYAKGCDKNDSGRAFMMQVTMLGRNVKYWAL